MMTENVGIGRGEWFIEIIGVSKTLRNVYNSFSPRGHLAGTPARPMDEIPSDVKQFIAKHISSVDQLEVLLLLRDHPEREWSAQDVGRQLHMSYASALLRLANLRSRGLV